MMKYEKKLMVTILGVLMVLLQTSCVNGKWVRGNGNVVKEDREVASFRSISASNGMDVYLVQGDKEAVTVEADENLMEVIVTEVRGNTLFIKTSENIRRAKSRKVYVTFINVDQIDASSGSDVFSEGVIKGDVMDFEVSSGADLKLSVEARDVSCSVSSGADADLRGKVEMFHGKASSGSDLRAGELKSMYCEASASSGGDVHVYVEKELKARASSGGDVIYYGDPEKVDKHASSGGDVNRR